MHTMSEAAPEQDRSPPDGGGGSSLPSARDITVPPPARTGSARRGRERPPRDRPAKPRPARDLGAPQAPAPAEEAPAAPTVAEIEVDGRAWTVRVLGSSGSVRGGRGAPLLLLGFTPRDAEADGPVGEALVVGRSLEALSGSELEAAFRRARTPPAPEGARSGRRR